MNITCFCAFSHRHLLLNPSFSFFLCSWQSYRCSANGEICRRTTCASTAADWRDSSLEFFAILLPEMFDGIIQNHEGVQFQVPPCFDSQSISLRLFSLFGYPLSRNNISVWCKGINQAQWCVYWLILFFYNLVFQLFGATRLNFYFILTRDGLIVCAWRTENFWYVISAILVFRSRCLLILQTRSFLINRKNKCQCFSFSLASCIFH